jgi:hypothetical protein
VVQFLTHCRPRRTSPFGKFANNRHAKAFKNGFNFGDLNVFAINILFLFNFGGAQGARVLV